MSQVCHLLRRMRFLEKLLWNLTKVVDETDRRVLLEGIVNAVKGEISAGNY
jgi:hypothetical protein